MLTRNPLSRGFWYAKRIEFHSRASPLPTLFLSATTGMFRLPNRLLTTDGFDKAPADVALATVHDDVQIEGIVLAAVVPASVQTIVARYDSLTDNHWCRASVLVSKHYETTTY